MTLRAIVPTTWHRRARRFQWILFGPAVIVACGCGAAPDWSQWAGDALHSGQASSAGQAPARILFSMVLDPFAAAEGAEGEDALLVHYATPLLDGEDVFVTVKTGRFSPCQPPGSGRPSPCGMDDWTTQRWSVKALRWSGDHLSERWTVSSDWRPELRVGFEPVFQPALSGDFVYAPGLGGSVYKLRRTTGEIAAHIEPLTGSGPETFVAGPLTIDPHGNVYFNALRLDVAQPWTSEVVGAWLVKIGVDDRVTVATFTDLVGGAPRPADACLGEFSAAELPWPPSPSARPASSRCGSQRPGVNVAPAVARDGTVYTVSRAHFSSRYSYLVAVTPELRPRWAGSLRGHLSDGCGSAILPPTGSLGGCRAGATDGVDPATNERPAGRVIDSSSSSPVIAPDGSVLYGAYTRYNGARGHLFRFSADGDFLSSYDFGWDSTPAIAAGGSSRSWAVVVKDNHYDVGSYCGNPRLCPPGPEAYRITRLSPSLSSEWQFTHTNRESCTRMADGRLSCVQDRPYGSEWCINAPAVDRHGAVYALNEDGNLYVIGPGGEERGRLFLERAIGAAYTPVAVDHAGRIYAQNYGRLFVIGL